MSGVPNYGGILCYFCEGLVLITEGRSLYDKDERQALHAKTIHTITYIHLVLTIKHVMLFYIY